MITKYFFSAMAVVLFSLPAHSAEVEGIISSDNYVAEDKTLILTGAGLLRYWGFKAYTGALCLEEGASVDEFWSDTAKRINTSFKRRILGL